MLGPSLWQAHSPTELSTSVTAGHNERRCPMTRACEGILLPHTCRSCLFSLLQMSLLCESSLLVFPKSPHLLSVGGMGQKAKPETSPFPTVGSAASSESAIQGDALCSPHTSSFLVLRRSVVMSLCLDYANVSVPRCMGFSRSAFGRSLET